MSANQAKIIKGATATQLMHESRYRDTCQLSYDKHLSTATVRAMSRNIGVKNIYVYQQGRLLVWNHSGSSHAHNVSKSLIDSWRETGQHNFEWTFLDNKTHKWPAFNFFPPVKQKHTEFHLNPFGFKPPQLTNTGGFSLFYCKNTTGNSIFKTEMIYMVMSTV